MAAVNRSRRRPVPPVRGQLELALDAPAPEPQPEPEPEPPLTAEQRREELFGEAG